MHSGRQSQCRLTRIRIANSQGQVILRHPGAALNPYEQVGMNTTGHGRAHVTHPDPDRPRIDEQQCQVFLRHTVRALESEGKVRDEEKR